MRHYFNRKTAGLVLSAVMAFTALPSGTAFYADEYTTDTEEVFAAGENTGEDLPYGARDAYTENTVDQVDDSTEEAVSDDVFVIDGDIAETDTEDVSPDVTEDLFADEDVLPDGLIEEMGQDEVSELPGDVFEMTLADPFTPDNTDCMKEEGIFLLASSERASASSSSFGTAYRQQLTGRASVMYDRMVDHYINNRGTGDWRISCSAGDNGYSIHVDDLSSYSESPEYAELMNEIQYDMQSMRNAFDFDYPEVFWERISNFTWAVKKEADSEGAGGTVCIESMKIKTVESYTGSRNDIDAFFAAVDNAVAHLSESCDYNEDGVVSDAEYAKGAHDFSAGMIHYDSTMLSIYRNNPKHSEAYRIFTPAPAFIESIGGGGVCEAFSRTIKVLLDRAGVTCCLLAGNNHMWNGIMIDGAWYLADATWDDNDTDTPGTTYLLSGADSGHLMSGSITGTDAEMIFSLPVISPSKYHEFGEWTDIQQVSCLADGIRQRTCFLCGQEEMETIPAPPHEFTEWTIAKQPACGQAGRSTRTCTVCGRVETESIPALEHEFGEWTVETPASCEQAGKRTRTCSICKKTETEKIPATGHSYGEWKTVKNASCTENGTGERICSSCRKKETEELPATGHSYSSKAVAPTCTSDGYTLHTCAGCGSTYKDSYVKATGHKFGKDSAKSTPATCTAEGEDVYVCSACGETKKETVEKTDHSWSAWKTVSPATVFSKAGQERTCTACGKKETRKTGSVLSAKISVNASSIKLKKRQKTTKITVSGLAKGDSVASWTSSNTKIVTCGNGWIKAGKKTGTAYVTVTTKAGASTRIKVKVQKAKVAVSKISVSSKKITLSKGQSFSLNTVLSPLTTEYPAKYKSSNKKTASVSKSGVIKARKKGKCTVTVKAGKKTVKVKVTVL